MNLLSQQNGPMPMPLLSIGTAIDITNDKYTATSNQWMTKDNVITYLNVNTSYLTSYTSNQFVPKSNIVAGVSGITVKFSNSEEGQVVDSSETVYSEKCL